MVREAQHKYTFPQTVKNPKKSLAAISKNNSEGKQPLAHSDSLFPHRISQTILCTMLFPAPQLWDASHPHSSVAPGGKTQSMVSPKTRHFPSSLAPTHPTRVRTLGSGAAPWAPPLGSRGWEGKNGPGGRAAPTEQPRSGRGGRGRPRRPGLLPRQCRPCGQPRRRRRPHICGGLSAPAEDGPARPGAARPRGARRQPLGAAEAAGPGRGAPRSCPRVCAPRAERGGAERRRPAPGSSRPAGQRRPPPAGPPSPGCGQGPCGTGSRRLGPFAGQRGHQRRGKRLSVRALRSVPPLPARSYRFSCSFPSCLRVKTFFK